MLGSTRFRFLNEEREIVATAAWNDPAFPKLWLYNLHYFDDLNAEGAKERKEWHTPLIRKWIEENPPVVGNGWEPYPTSIRIVNWIKWALAGNVLPEGASNSLAIQARCLEQSIETHLLGNHLFTNAKGLVFAGLFFEGREADRWLAKGLALLRREVPEQILKDGGHFERSPMYHSLILEDLLDLVNLGRAYPEEGRDRTRGLAAQWSETVVRMRKWLSAMCHPDGEISLFNDAAFGIAPSPRELDAYAERLGFPTTEGSREGVTYLADSGYIRLQGGEAVLFLDVGPLGPDYLPAHGHADTLSFELSLYGRRVIVDAGTSTYDTSPDRLYERGTSAHNTVVVDGIDSSEVWGSFRVARRARPYGIRIDEKDGEVSIECSHDGYRRLPGRVVHKRSWRFSGKTLKVVDTLGGRFRSAQRQFLLHPAVGWSGEKGDGRFPAGSTGCWEIPGGGKVEWRAGAETTRYEEARYSPEFGVSLKTVRLVEDIQEAESRFGMTWS
jgi:uncharacterized heparinase superfamily protein